MKMRMLVLALLFAGNALAQHEHGHGRPQAAESASPPPAADGAPSQRPGGRREWTRYPVLVPAMARDGERSARVRLLGIDAATIEVFAAAGPADQRHVSVPVTAGGADITPPNPKAGNYHWIVARSERQQGETSEVRVASTAWYFSNPGAAPTALLRETRHELEIVPEPLPREHGSYRESEKWNFLVRFNGQPLAGQAVTLETEFGTRTSFVSDAEGRLVVLFPRDFKPAPAGEGAGRHGGGRRAKFVLGTEYEQGGRRYLTAFNLTYGADPDRERSVALGAAFGVLGMIAAVPLLRRRKTNGTATEKEQG